MPLQVVYNIVFVMFSFYQLAKVDWRIAVMVVFIIPVFQIPARRFGSKLNAMRLDTLRTKSDMNNTINESLTIE